MLHTERGADLVELRVSFGRGVVVVDFQLFVTLNQAHIVGWLHHTDFHIDVFSRVTKGLLETFEVVSFIVPYTFINIVWGQSFFQALGVLFKLLPRAEPLETFGTSC